MTLGPLKKNTSSVPIYRRYSFLRKIPKYKTPTKFTVGFMEYLTPA
jgi:hypothetical protein